MLLFNSNLYYLHTKTEAVKTRVIHEEGKIKPKLRKVHQETVEESPLEKLKRLENGETKIMPRSCRDLDKIMQSHTFLHIHENYLWIKLHFMFLSSVVFSQ